jgi:hypothetical protein
MGSDVRWCNNGHSRFNVHLPIVDKPCSLQRRWWETIKSCPREITLPENQGALDIH